MKTLTIQPRKPRPRRLDAAQREKFTGYFMRRYPATRKIRISTRNNRAYTARAYYSDGDVRRTIIVQAYTYQSLVICMQSAYASRGL